MAPNSFKSILSDSGKGKQSGCLFDGAARLYGLGFRKDMASLEGPAFDSVKWCILVSFRSATADRQNLQRVLGLKESMWVVIAWCLNPPQF